MTSSLTARFKASSPTEQERALVLSARLLVKQAGILGHQVDDDLRWMAARPLPKERKAS